MSPPLPASRRCGSRRTPAAATPCRRGVVICTVHRGSAYVLTASRPGCRSGGQNLFSGTDPLQELVGGITFAR